MSGHAHAHAHGEGHSHGLVDASIKRSRAGLRAVVLAIFISACVAGYEAVLRLIDPQSPDVRVMADDQRPALNPVLAAAVP